MRACGLALLFCCTVGWACASSDHDHHDHGHGEGAHAFEWAGVFELPEALYLWKAQKVGGQYADATMKMAVLPATAATTAALEALESEGDHSLEASCTAVHPNGMIVPMEDACYELHFDAAVWESHYKINTSSVAAAAFFTQHVPTEFESTDHYLKDAAGDNAEPLAELPAKSSSSDEHEDHAEWGASILAAILVNLVTLIGVILVLPVFARLAASHAAVFEGVLCSFASGALMACALFLLLFEATHLVGEGWSTEVDILWRWGTMVLAGFFLPLVMDGISLAMEESGRVVVVDLRSDGVLPQAADETSGGEVVGVRSKFRLIAAVTMGDFVHNLCDGFFIGAAFGGCGVGFGWGVAMGTILHELPQELADYAVLTGKAVGLKPWKALVLNFLAGLSVILGVIIVNSAEVDNAAVGCLLAFGGGVYIYVAAVECLPKVHHLPLSARSFFVCALVFVLGAILIGLILLDHEHCVPEGGSGGDGHAHHHH